MKKSVQFAQLLGSTQRPWMKTTGVVPEALAASISRFSRSEIDAITNPPSVRVGAHRHVTAPTIRATVAGGAEAAPQRRRPSRARWRVLGGLRATYGTQRAENTPRPFYGPSDTSLDSEGEGQREAGGYGGESEHDAEDGVDQGLAASA